MSKYSLQSVHSVCNRIRCSLQKYTFSEADIKGSFDLFDYLKKEP